ncbi:uncharacterized protein B0P05DRAFT_575322 [Gilbertella persicaria]|uniref:uncharacterized protein n=1 Tax=Gilbertella persicaria TaxID=101096 RepID=UPI00221F6406|nr:uncharacterized protein B0P05DRAFT_575322 [Gilbertella persicaria]KAI8055595.1 hypothetical protein B0P05DRAFT_575322 [Gilbertella persicaria]
MYINGLKYACSTCIKGHRSSHCSHVDRPLFEIRKKGRPVTQCTFCRDLRKTKQVHIKCACDKKGGENNTQQPLLIYQQSSINNDMCQDKKTDNQCTCPAIAAAAALASTKSSKSTIKSSVGAYPSQDTLNSASTITNNIATTATNEVISDTLLATAPLCPTAAPPSSLKEESLSYSWALITSPSTNQIDLPNTSTLSAPSNLFTNMMNDNQIEINNPNDSNLHLGFIFHKPTSSQRFLDGQPRTRRHRSSKRTANRLPANAVLDPISTTAVDTFTDYSNLSTPPSSTVSPHPPSSASSSIAPACEPMDMQFDYLTEQLEILSNSNNNQGFVGDLSNAEELTAILSNVLSKDEEDMGSVSSTATHSHRSSISTQATTTTTNMSPMVPIQRSHCGSFVPRATCCKSLGSPGGESVVITITPLSNTNNNEELLDHQSNSSQQQNYPTTTRIVTCYCGNQCTCPGCLVHPGNFFLGSDPYAGPLIPSSSASSSCYGSDEEEASVAATNTMLNTSSSNSNYLHFS